MKAIQTRYLGPTERRPARIKAWIEGLPAMVVSVWTLRGHRNHREQDDDHRAAAVALCRKHGWAPVLVSGTLPNGDRCHVWGRSLESTGGRLEAAARACLVDLDHYASTHGPGPDRRLDELRAALGDS